jgi:hypothetical protein
VARRTGQGLSNPEIIRCFETPHRPGSRLGPGPGAAAPRSGTYGSLRMRSRCIWSWPRWAASNAGKAGSSGSLKPTALRRARRVAEHALNGGLQSCHLGVGQRWQLRKAWRVDRDGHLQEGVPVRDHDWLGQHARSPLGNLQATAEPQDQARPGNPALHHPCCRSACVRMRYAFLNYLPETTITLLQPLLRNATATRLTTQAPTGGRPGVRGHHRPGPARRSQARGPVAVSRSPRPPGPRATRPGRRG